MRLSTKDLFPRGLWTLFTLLVMLGFSCHKAGETGSVPCCPGSFPYLENASFRAYVADNRGKASHFSGYNGLAALIPHCLGQNIFVPHYAGLNYETIEMEGNIPYDKRFEPRFEPMEITQNDQDIVVLHQARTGHSRVSAVITFRIEEPYYLHQRIELTFHKQFAPQGAKQRFSSLFASYIFMPEDPHLYIRPAGGTDDPLTGWYAIYKDDNLSGNYLFRPLPDDQHLSPRQHSSTLATTATIIDTLLLEGRGADEIPLHYYYGLLWDSLVFIQLFKQPEGFRFAYSPSWGGHVNNWVEGREYDSPAWDYRLFHDNIQTGRTYAWDCCIIVKPFAGREDVIEEFKRYMNE